MPYSNNNSKDNTKISVNTSSFTFFNNESQMLELSFLDESFSIAFRKPVINDAGKKTYPSENKKYAILRPEMARSLLYKIDNQFMRPALEQYKGLLDGTLKLDDGNVKPITVETINYKGTFIVQLYFLAPTEMGEFRPELRVYEDLDENSKIPGSCEKYAFGTNRSIRHYNPETGDFETTTEYTQFLMFVDCLRSYTLLMSRASAHAARYVENFKNREMTRLIREIATRNGIEVSYGYNNNSGGSVFSAQQRPNTEVSNVDAAFAVPAVTDDLPF